MCVCVHLVEIFTHALCGFVRASTYLFLNNCLSVRVRNCLFILTDMDSQGECFFASICIHKSV